jgi:hypothetical protein
VRAHFLHFSTKFIENRRDIAWLQLFINIIGVHSIDFCQKIILTKDITQNHNFAAMNRKNILFVAGCCLFFLASCQSSNDQIVRKWQVESVDNPSQDSMMNVQRKSIDTISTLDSAMIEYFQSTNLDSIKKEIQIDFDKSMAERKKQFEEYVKQITMEFRSDSIMLQTVMGNSDSAKWFLADSKTIVLSPLNPMPGAPDSKDTFFIDKSSSNELRLKIAKAGSISYINMKAATESKSAKEETQKTEEQK